MVIDNLKLLSISIQIWALFFETNCFRDSQQIFLPRKLHITLLLHSVTTTSLTCWVIMADNINNKSNMNISGAAHHKGYFCVTPPWELWNLAHSCFALCSPATIMMISIRLRWWWLARRWCCGSIPLVAPANSNCQIRHMSLTSEVVWLQIWHKMRLLSIKHSALES